MTIASILKIKGRDVVSVAPHASLAEVAAVLASRRIGAALVQAPDGDMLGIISERDLVRALARHREAALSLPAEQIMTSEVCTASPSTTVGEAMELMTRGRFRHLPVMEGRDLRGLVSIGDIVKARLSEQAHEVDSLKAYVAGA